MVRGGVSATWSALQARVQGHAPWLLEEALGVAVVGTTALRIAAELRSPQDGDLPRPGDLDLSWLPDVASGSRILAQHGVEIPTTEGNRDRGTLAFWLEAAPARPGGSNRERIEITTLREGSGTELATRIKQDLSARDMTLGAIAVPLAGEAPVVHDPWNGLEDWRHGNIRAVGDPLDRVHEHPVRWLRYYRKAHALGFSVDGAIRKLKADPGLLASIPPEAVAAEVRSGLLDAPCPGSLLMEWYEAGLLAALMPELAPQFDGRPAGPIRHHPEISQALHMVLVLRWAADTLRAEGDDWDEDARARVMVAALCHDLGKGLTPNTYWPGHRGHEEAGLPLVDGLLDRLPGLTDKIGRRLAQHVCALHLQARQIHQLQPKTIAKRYREYFRGNDYPVEEFALAVAADSAGRLGRGELGSTVRAQVTEDLHWIRERCGSVDAGRIRAEVEAEGGDLAAFQLALHRAQAAALRK